MYCSSAFVACRMLVNGPVISMKAASLFVLSASITSCQMIWTVLLGTIAVELVVVFLGRPLTRMAFQEGEDISPVCDGELWRQQFAQQYFKPSER